MNGQYDLARLKNCMKRAQAGEALTLAFLGGSITQGSLASRPENTYVSHVCSWWRETFPQAEIASVNAGIGGTSSHYGAARAVFDILKYQPDFVMVDFCVNDRPEAFFQETYEGLVRKILRWDSKPALVLLNNVFYDSGENAQDYHNAVGDWYHVPHVSIRDTLCQKLRCGMYKREELTPDGLHPNDRGHRLVAEEILAFLETVREHLNETEEESAFPEPLTANAYESAKRLTIGECCPKMSGFRADTEEKTGLLDHFKNGWIGKRAGDRIIFETEASCIAVQYRKTIRRPALRARLVLDGDEAHPVLLDGNFDEDWGDCLYLEPVLHHGKRGKHTVEIEVLPAQWEEQKDQREDPHNQQEPFYLIALVIA